MALDISIRPLHSLEDFHRCVQIAREVWGDSELDTEPYITFVIVEHLGGQVLGAFDGHLMVGFTKAYIALHGSTPYLHSHMTGVLASHRDRHIGRQLKLFQREDALRRGIRLIEWTFDPLETKNAHFNINRLGAICRHYIPNFYGITTSPLHRGMPTDRLLVEWHLDSKRAIAAINQLTPEPRDYPVRIHLPNPVAQGGSELAHRSLGAAGSPAAFSSPSAGAPPSNSEGGSSSSSDSVLLETQSRLRQEFTGWFAKGYAVLGVRSTPSGTDYCLAPYSDF